MTVYSYQEDPNSLNSRIDSHAKYSDFSLHRWLAQNLDIQPGARILDLGCGNGNFTAFFCQRAGAQGVVWGLDKDAKLLAAARAEHGDIPPTRLRYIHHDFEREYTGYEYPFDWIFALYSIYYVNDAERLMHELIRWLAPGGQIVIVGPGPANARGLLSFNTLVTGQEASSSYLQRLARIQRCFKPCVARLLGEENTTYSEINHDMTFPTAESYAQYYWSTLLWRESVQALRAPIKTVERNPGSKEGGVNGLPAVTDDRRRSRGPQQDLIGALSPETIQHLRQRTLEQAGKHLPLVLDKQISVLIGKKPPLPCTHETQALSLPQGD